MTSPARVEPGAGQRALHGSIAGAVAFVVNLVLALVLVPVLLSSWGAERYGLWLSLQSLFTLLTTLDTGHQAYVGNKLIYLHAADRAKARTLFASGFLGAALLGGLELSLAAVLLLSGKLPWALGQSGRALEPSVAVAFALLMIGWVVQGSAGGACARLYPAAGQYARSVWWGIGYRILYTLVLMAAVALGADIWAAVVALTLMTLAYMAMLFSDVRARFPDFYPFWRGAELRGAVLLLARSLVITACTASLQLGQHGVNVLLSATLGMFVLPAFATTRMIANLFLQAAAIVTQPLLPEMVRWYGLGEHHKLADTARAIWLVTGAPVNLGLCLGLPFYRPVFEALTGGTMAFDVELFAWLALAISLHCLGAPFSALIEGVNALRPRVWSALAQTVLTLGCLVLALPAYGVRAAGVAVALGELCGGVLVPVLSVWALSPELRRRLPVRALLLGAAPSLVVVGSLFAVARGIASLPAVMAVALALGGLLYFLQWSELDPIMQGRLLALARFGRRPVVGAREKIDGADFDRNDRRQDATDSGSAKG